MAVCLDCHVYFCSGTEAEIRQFLADNPGKTEQRFRGMNRKMRRNIARGKVKVVG